jgi:hypothetical protein
MKKTSVFDVCGDEIVEGDRLSYHPKHSPIQKTYIDFFNIDTIIVEVLDLKGAIGCEIVLSYFSKGIQVAHTYQDDLDYFSKHPHPDNNWNGKRNFIKYLKKKNLSLSHLKVIKPISSVRDIHSFNQYFFYPPKEIITRKIHGEERLNVLSQNPNYNLFFELENKIKMINNQSYIIELSDTSKAFVLKQAKMFCKLTPLLDDFTHLKAVFKEYSAPFHRFAFYCCNSRGEAALSEYVFNLQNFDNAVKDVEATASILFDHLIFDKSHCINTKFNTVQQEKDFYIRKGRSDASNDKLLMDVVPTSEMFISATSSFDVLVRLVRDGSTFKEI